MKTIKHKYKKPSISDQDVRINLFMSRSLEYNPFFWGHFVRSVEGYHNMRRHMIPSTPLYVPQGNVGGGIVHRLRTPLTLPPRSLIRFWQRPLLPNDELNQLINNYGGIYDGSSRSSRWKFLIIKE